MTRHRNFSLLMCSGACLFASAIFAGAVGFVDGSWTNDSPSEVYGHYEVTEKGCPLEARSTGDFGPLKPGGKIPDEKLIGCKLKIKWCNLNDWSNGSCTPYFGVDFPEKHNF